MISKSMKELVENSSAIRAMFEEGKRLAKEYGEENVYDFSLGNPSVYPPKEVKQAIYDILANEDENLVHGYMNNGGYPDVREAIALSINKEYSMDFGWENIVMTSGAAGAMNIIFKTLLEPGDEVVVFAPYFGEYKRYIENYGGCMILIPADTERFQLDLDGLAAALTKRTKAVIINSPNNPSGAIYTAETLKSLSDILSDAQKKFSSSIYLISDEPYRKIVYDNVEVPYVPQFYKNTLVAYSYSKSLSLPGERIGYIAASSSMDDFGDVMQGLATANRVLGFVNSPSLFQRVAAKCCDVQADVQPYQENLDILYDGLTEMGYECLKPQGAFYLFPKSPIADDVEFCRRAKAYNLLIVPGRSFGCGGFFRIAYCVPKQRAQNSLPYFKKLIDSLEELKK